MPWLLAFKTNSSYSYSSSPNTSIGSSFGRSLVSICLGIIHRLPQMAVASPQGSKVRTFFSNGIGIGIGIGVGIGRRCVGATVIHLSSLHDIGLHCIHKRQEFIVLHQIIIIHDREALPTISQFSSVQDNVRNRSKTI
jgi:hypothetical protein